MNLYSLNSQALTLKYVPESIAVKTDYQLVEMAQDSNLPKGKRDLAIRALLFRHLAAVKNQCRAYAFGKVTPMMVQAACEGFIQSIQRFDLNNPKQVKFLTFAWWYIRKGAQAGLTEKVKDESTLPLERAAAVADLSRSNSSAWLAVREDVRSAVSKVVKDKQALYYLENYYGLNGKTPTELKVIASNTRTPLHQVKKSLRLTRESLKGELKAYA